MIEPVFRLATALALVVTPAEAQWSSTSFDGGASVHRSEALLLHDDGTSLRGFAALGNDWVDLAPSGSIVHDVEAHVALFGDLSTVSAWNARSGVVDSMVFTALVFADAGAEVALVIDESGTGLVAQAYSTHHG